MTNDFDKKGYEVVNNFLDKETCNQLTNYLKDLVNSKQTYKDDQCPLSQATYSTAVTDKILEEVLPQVEQVTNKTLYPTYAFARLYSPNDELKVHRDRPSCEYSVTLTLEYEGNKWAIYMGPTEDKQNAFKIEMDTGDAVIYKGCDVWHWREKYTEGKWQAQIFLHYVDAQGPYAEYKYDKRTQLEHHPKLTNYASQYILLPNYLDHSLCDTIIKNSKDSPISKPLLNDNHIDHTIRSVDRVELKPNHGLAGMLTSVGLNINADYFKFNITKSDQSELLIYNKKDHYTPHLDVMPSGHLQRKLTVLALLNDDFEGGRFVVHTASNDIYPDLKKGSVIVFPSYLLHGVEPVTKGSRYSCVSWMVGPHFK